jgi:glycolate oxidase
VKERMMSRAEGKEKLKKMRKELFLATQQCIGCEFCVPSCPLHSGWLTDSATGKMQSLHYAMKRGGDLDERLKEILYSCTLCGSCEYKCKSLSQSVKVTDIVRKARQLFVKAGRGPMPVHKKMIETLKTLGNPLQEPIRKRKDEYPPTFKRKEHAETLIYFGCLTSFQDFEIIPSTFQILEGAKVDCTALEVEEFCCGYIAHLVGSEDEFKNCQETNLNAISKVKPKQLVTTCAGCFLTFKNLYPEGSFNGVTVLHSVQYLESLIKEGKIRFKSLPPQKVIYHDPCDLGRQLGIFEPPRNILREIPGVKLMEFEANRYNADCCGGGGGYKAVDTEKSLEVASKRVEAAAKAGAEVIVSACPACKRNLQLAADIGVQQKKWRIQVMDITELVAQGMAENP